MHRTLPAALLAANLLICAARAASLPDAAACGAAIAVAERAAPLPARLLGAIGVVESGRFDPISHAVAPWPWSINVAGTDEMFATAPEAIAAVRAAQAAGIRSIDVGCMQISLLHHPDAFVSLEQAFDPAANVAYASRFLQSLRLQTGDWAGAVAAYHSMTPDIGAAYAGRVAGVWPLAARYGLSAAALPGGRLSLEDEVDPRRLLTPEFRAELVAAAAFRRQQDMALGAGFQAFRGQGSGPSRPRHGTRMPALAALEDEVDPRHLLTPEFRAQRAEAAAFRYQEEAALDRATRSGAP